MHGIKVNELTTGARPIVPIASAVIGLVATATAAAGAPAAALDAAFPLNTPVLVTDIRSAIGDAGTGGTLLPALEAIADQTSPILVVVRVAPGEDDAETTANVIGGNTGGVATGMQCLLDAQAQLGIRPRILGCPGLDVQEVTAEMVIVAKRLRGMVYARAIGDEIADVLTYREEFSARELMLVWPNFTNSSRAMPLPAPWACAPASTKSRAGTRRYPTSRSMVSAASTNRSISTCRMPPPPPACSTMARSPPSSA